ncbi:hypothetical protein T484DRAFT_1779000 [Baffinella frigidus]|nr:hypothetical protein T484DRAFT_1779000 [Cryptophyta sp. CCMP2293]
MPGRGGKGRGGGRGGRGGSRGGASSGIGKKTRGYGVGGQKEHVTASSFSGSGAYNAKRGKDKRRGTSNAIIVPGTLAARLSAREAAALAAGGDGGTEEMDEDGGAAEAAKRPSYLDLAEIVPRVFEEAQGGDSAVAVATEPAPAAGAAGAGGKKGGGARAVLPRVVPWRDWGEWALVGRGLLGGAEGGEGVGAAVGRVRAWQTRGKDTVSDF